MRRRLLRATRAVCERAAPAVRSLAATPPPTPPRAPPCRRAALRRPGARVGPPQRPRKRSAREKPKTPPGCCPMTPAAALSTPSATRREASLPLRRAWRLAGALGQRLCRGRGPPPSAAPWVTSAARWRQPPPAPARRCGCRRVRRGEEVRVPSSRSERPPAARPNCAATSKPAPPRRSAPAPARPDGAARCDRPRHGYAAARDPAQANDAALRSRHDAQPRGKYRRRTWRQRAVGQ
jgi:hypothetical protein